MNVRYSRNLAVFWTRSRQPSRTKFFVVVYCAVMLTTIVFGALSLEGKSHTVFAHLNVHLVDQPCRELCGGGCVDWGREEEHEGGGGLA